MAIDRSGNVYVTGFSYGSVMSADYALIKYDSSGNVRWVRRYDGTAGGDDRATAVTVDDSNNVYVTGASSSVVHGFDYVTVKYDSAGNWLWVATYDGPAHYHDEATAIVLDDSGNVYVTGSSYGTISWYPDYATVKYDPAGNELWVARYNGPGNETDRTYAIAVDDSHNVYVTGYSAGSGTSSDYATIKYVQFLCGDVNKDGVVDVADVMYLINYLFIGGSPPDPLQAGDVNRDGAVDIADVMYLINYLFIGGSPPCEP